MASDWRAETPEERAEYERWLKRKVRLAPHHFVARKRLPWPMCQRCGLLRLKNDRTRRAVRKGCEKDD